MTLDDVLAKITQADGDIAEALIRIAGGDYGQGVILLHAARNSLECVRLHFPTATEETCSPR